MQRNRPRQGLRTIVLATATAFGVSGFAMGTPSAASIAAPTPVERATAIVAQMTLDEKITELHGIGTQDHWRSVPPIPRLGIPGLVITNGPAGVGPGDSLIHLLPATALPAPIALAASFDTALARGYGVLTGSEARDLGNDVLEGPDENLLRIPTNGRAFESYGEDPFLDASIGSQNIEGIQAKGVIDEVKHYAANNQENNRFAVNEVVDQRTLHEIYLPHFESAVRDAHAGAVMCAYPVVNGVHACENTALLNDILRQQWGFDGFVQSDFGATHGTVPSMAAGMALEMPSGANYNSTKINQAIAAGQLSVHTVDSLLISRFATMIRFGMFDRTHTTAPIPVAADGAVARTAAESGAVLLKNSGSQLPLNPVALHSIAVIGPYAGAAYTGGGGSSKVLPLYTVNPVDGIKKRVGPAVSVSLNNGADPVAAAAAARAADVAVLMVGDAEQEGGDRPNLSLPGNQDQLIAAVAAANPHTVVVLKSGGAVLMPWLNQVPSVLEAWYPGQEDGNAVAALLFGDFTPSGKLPVTFPASDNQVPASTPQQYPGVNGNAVYSEGLQVGYRWYDAQGQTPLFPFGYGLSYTTFAFSHLTVSPRAADGSVHVGVDVSNTGKRSGAEVAQVYLTFPSAAGEPPHQLKGFQKVHLDPGMTRHVTITLNARSFATWNTASANWTTIPGQYGVFVGDSSRNLPLQATVTITGK
jgi:beta-glucosidase